jgi:hypothetical protein
MTAREQFSQVVVGAAVVLLLGCEDREVNAFVEGYAAGLEAERGVG